MGAYNKYFCQHCCHNDFLVNQVLKRQWGFDGVYISDWAGAHDTQEAIDNGLDIEMGTELPYVEYYLAAAQRHPKLGDLAQLPHLFFNKVRIAKQWELCYNEAWKAKRSRS